MPNEIACPLCGETVKQVASATLSLSLWQHVNWTCLGNNTMLPVHKLRLTLQWVADKINEGIIEHSPNYMRSHLGFERIAQRELDAICLAVNTFMSSLGSPVNISNRDGKILYHIFGTK